MVVAARSSFLAALVGAYMTRACHCQVLALVQSVRGALEKAGAAHPDLWFIDAGLPKLLTPEVKATVAKQTPRIRMIAFSVPAEKQTITSLLACGFTVLLAEDATLSELSQAVRSARANVPFFSSSLVTLTESDYIERALRTTEHPAVQLTRREQEIREAVARGESSKDIGRRLGVATRTIDKHREHIRDKLRRQARVVGQRGHT
jgi:two-component system, NarL family, nitrate/nitrite response regulator NarL